MEGRERGEEVDEEEVEDEVEVERKDVEQLKRCELGEWSVAALLIEWEWLDECDTNNSCDTSIPQTTERAKERGQKEET